MLEEGMCITFFPAILTHASYWAATHAQLNCSE